MSRLRGSSGCADEMAAGLVDVGPKPAEEAVRIGPNLSGETIEAASNMSTNVS